jgi:hypothetical protein
MPKLWEKRGVFLATLTTDGTSTTCRATLAPRAARQSPLSKRALHFLSCFIRKTFSSFPAGIFECCARHTIVRQNLRKYLIALIDSQSTDMPERCRDSPAFLGFTMTYKPRGDCQSSRKSYKTSHFVGWIVGWHFRRAALYARHSEVFIHKLS